MKSARDRWIALGAGVVVLVIAVAVVWLVFDVQRRGRDAIERERGNQVEQLAGNMDTRLSGSLTGMAAIAAQTPFTLEPGSEQDVAILLGIQELFGDLIQSGFLVIDASGTIVNGTLLPEGTIGSTLERAGLDRGLASGEPGILDVAEGITIARPVTTTYGPILGENGEVRGLLAFEGSVDAESSFNDEVANLKVGETGLFAFVDGMGTTIASSDPALIAEPYPDSDIITIEAGVHRGDDGRIRFIQDIPAVGWRAISSQDIDEFEAGLGEQVQRAILVLMVAAVIAGALTFIFLLRRLRAAREEQRRLSELNETREEFISIVSHELRTPVAGVVGFLQSTLDHWETMDENARRHAVERASSNARRLHGLTRDILDTAAIESGELSYAFDVIDLAEEVRAAVIAARDFHGGREIHIDAPSEQLWVRADPDRIQQVMTNLLDNALKQSPPETAVEVRLTAQEDGKASVTFVDRGPGMSEAELDTIFEKFVRGRGAGVSGTGLGLYICRQIIEAHDGEIGASSLEGMGATFTFTVPMSETQRESVGSS